MTFLSDWSESLFIFLQKGLRRNTKRLSDQPNKIDELKEELLDYEFNLYSYSLNLSNIGYAIVNE